jgi:hypothetical protein
MRERRAAFSRFSCFVRKAHFEQSLRLMAHAVMRGYQHCASIARVFPQRQAKRRNLPNTLRTALGGAAKFRRLARDEHYVELVGIGRKGAGEVADSASGGIAATPADRALLPAR